MFGAHIAHVILNWEEDKLVFRGTCILNVSGKNALKPLPKKYAIKFRMLRLFILIAWVIAEGCLGFYNKVAKCRKFGDSRDLNDFDEVEDSFLESYLDQTTKLKIMPKLSKINKIRKVIKTKQIQQIPQF